MKKTLFLLFCTILMTGLLFFSGSYLLDLVALSDTLDPAQIDVGAGDGDGGGADPAPGDPDFRVGLPGFSFFAPFNANASYDFMDVLRGFKQETGDSINILVLVGDSGDNTDAVMVMRYDPKTSDFNIISIPRDTYITLQGYTFHKVNSVYKVKDGPERLKALLEGMLGQKIDYYVNVNLKTVREIVDLLGGVDYDVPCDMVYDDPDQNLHINLKKGRRTLTGKQVEGLLRFRMPNSWTREVRQFYDGSDIKRIERQHDFFSEMIRQKLNVKYVTKVSEIIDTVYSNIQTDLPLSEMLKLARGLPGISSDSFQTATLPGEAKYIGGVSYYIHDAEQSRALAASMLGGEAAADNY
ncbi:MAG: LCP family protein [Oscillospiraceae bacterium]|nr:LCP family protein [Oscillospiraceae bacterium]